MTNTNRIEEAKLKLESVGICIDLETVHTAIDEAVTIIEEIQRDYVLMPREPTEGMVEAAERKSDWVYNGMDEIISYPDPGTTYKAMIGAYENEK